MDCYQIIFFSISFLHTTPYCTDVLQYQLPSLLFDWFLVTLFLLFVVVLLGEHRQKQERGLVYRKQVQAPQLFHCWPFQGGSSFFVLIGHDCCRPLGNLLKERFHVNTRNMWALIVTDLKETMKLCIESTFRFFIFLLVSMKTTSEVVMFEILRKNRYR